VLYWWLLQTSHREIHTVISGHWHTMSSAFPPGPEPEFQVPPSGTARRITMLSGLQVIECSIYVINAAIIHVEHTLWTTKVASAAGE
jgi:hypothetical protein